MALNTGFHRWLSERGLNSDTISILEKESILQESTLKLLSESDLESVRKKHRITMGQFALLRSVRSDLLEVDEDGFELVTMEDAQVQPTGVSGQPGHKTAKKGEKSRVQGKKESAKGVMSDNLAKAAHRERHLQAVADASGVMASSADEYSRLAVLLAEKKRREAVGTSRTSSNSSMESSTASKSSANNHSSSKRPSRQHDPNEADIDELNTGSSQHKRNDKVASDPSGNQQDGNVQCCIIL